MLSTLTLVVVLLRHAHAHALPVDGGKTERPDAYDYAVEKNNATNKGGVEPEVDEEYDGGSPRDEATTEVCMDVEDVLWYYLLPVLVYFFVAVLAMGLVLLLVHCVLCARKLCPGMFWCCPCEIGIFHRTTVAEEREPDCRTKDKLQLSLVNVNKHYYRLDGTDSPSSPK